jgi:hypothetical protein
LPPPAQPGMHASPRHNARMATRAHVVVAIIVAVLSMKAK